MFKVILKSLNAENEQIVLSYWPNKEGAEQSRRQWRKALGGSNWSVNRRPGLDTLDHLALVVEE